MTNDDIAQKLALLPEGLDEENLQTWQRAIRYYQEKVLDYPGSRFKYLLDLVENISKSEDAKLFRAYPDLWMLILSTTTKEERNYGDFFIVVGLTNENIAQIVCCRPTGIVESVDCKSNETFLILQPFLDRLWNETRGKKKAF